MLMMVVCGSTQVHGSGMNRLCHAILVMIAPVPPVAWPVTVRLTGRLWVLKGARSAGSCVSWTVCCS